MVEFVNERMTPTEVLAVEIRQYLAGDEQVLMPRLLGQMVAAQQQNEQRSRSSRATWTEADVYEALDSLPESARAAGRSIFEYLLRTGDRAFYGRGQSPGVAVYYGSKQQPWLAANVWAGPPTPNVWLNFATIRAYRTPDESRLVLMRLMEVPALVPVLAYVAADDYKRLPSFPLQNVLDQPGVADAFCAAIDDLRNRFGTTT